MVQVVKNLPSNAEGVDSIPGRGTKIPHATGQLSQHTATTEPAHFGACALELMPQLERSSCACCNKISLVPQLRPDTAKNK